MTDRFLFFLLLLFCSVAIAGTPAIEVVEFTEEDIQHPLAGCKGVRLHRGEVWLSREVANWVTGRGQAPAGWKKEKGLQWVEEAKHLLLWRTVHRCLAFLPRSGAGVFPVDWQAQGFPFSHWRQDGDALRLQGHVGAILYPRQHRTLPAPFPGKPPLRFYHHGRLELFIGSGGEKVSTVRADDAATLYFEGPGDRARFLFQSREAGALIVERTPGNLPWLSLRIGHDSADMQPRGMLSLPAGGKAFVELGYSGFGPRQVDVGFLFSPDPALDCWIDVRREKEGLLQTTLVVVNNGSEPVTLHAPSSATVTWYAGEQLLAAAQPARLFEDNLLESGQRLRYQVSLSVPAGLVPDHAVFTTGGDPGVLHCFQAAGKASDPAWPGSVSRPE